MASQPPDDLLYQFLSIAQGADERIAIAFLKGANNNFERALQDYFDDPGKYHNRNNYDESAWSQDRSGDQPNTQIPAFQIDYAGNDQYPHSSAPTRPPSRVSQNSSTRGIPGSPQTGQDDAWRGQETGVVGVTGTQFGPANREYYDNSSWAMTIAGTSTVELIPDPFPTMRKREPGEPVFLKPLPTGDYLPSLIAILHSIPLAHLALNLEGRVLGEYGFDPAWWCGAAIKEAAVVDMVDEEHTASSKELLKETQRLMAFLDLSIRSYGSVDAISHMAALEEAGIAERSKTVCDRFLTTWETCANRLVPELLNQRTLFKSEVMIQSLGQPAEMTQFCTLHVVLTNQGTGGTQTIYDALDELIWNDDVDGTSSADQAISLAGPILCMRIEQPDFTSKGLNFHVPANWYADRYMNEYAPRTKAMRRNVSQHASYFHQLKERQQLITTHVNPKTGKKMDVRELLRITMAAFGPPTKVSLADDDLDIDVEAESKKYDITELPSRPDVLHKLEAITQNVQRKIDRLEEETLKIQRVIERESALLKEPSDDPDEPQPKIRYSLCGVATDSLTTYVLERATEALVKMDDDDPKRDQWWRLHYSNDTTITKVKVTEETVLKNASQESRDVMLVYATDEALHPVDVNINEPLRAFMAKDNETFTAELADAEEAAAAKQAADALDIAPLTDWETAFDPPNYPPPETSFVPDDGKIRDDEEYARESNRENAKRMKSQNGEAVLSPTQPSSAMIETTLALEPTNDSDGKPEARLGSEIHADAPRAEGVTEMTEHVEHARGGP